MKKYKALIISILLAFVLSVPSVTPLYAETDEVNSSEPATEEKKEAEDHESSDSDSGKSESSKEESGGGESSDTEAKSESESGSEPKTESESGDSTQSEPDQSSQSLSTESQGESTEKKKQTVKKKKTVKDDSNGRDYQESEEISSGNTSFTIVSVSRDEEAINKKIKQQKKKKKKLDAELAVINEKIDNVQAELDNIQAIYDMIRSATGTDHPELYLSGCPRNGAYLVREDCVENLDEELEILADMFHSEELSAWVKTFSTALVPQIFADQASAGTELSNATPILESMKTAAQAELSKETSLQEPLQKQVADAGEHIKLLEEQKKESTIQIDERLVEYKAQIPDEAIGFLNAAVAKEGCPYVWGADGPNSFDCSGLISYALRQCKAVSSGFRWTSYDFVSNLRSIPFSQARPGDLVWKHGHIAIYIDENTVFEAPYTGANVRFTECTVSSRFSKVLRWWSEDKDD